MARTVNEIKQIIITAKSNEIELAGYTSPSATQLLNLLAYITAVCVWTLEVLFDNLKQETDAKIASLIPGTLRWYHAKCFEFQFSDALAWVDGKFTYSINDAVKMIVKRASIKEVSGQLRIKVAKETSGVPGALSIQELDSFKSYMSKIKFAGTNLSIISYGACLVDIRLNLVYDSLTLTVTGTTISDATPVVQNAIENYLRTILYGGMINRTKLVDAVQLVPGVVDVYIEGIWTKEENAIAWDAILTQNFEAISGYYKFNLLTLTATPNV